MSDLNNSWKQTLKSFIIAFSDLGNSLVQSAKVGADAAVKWAKTDNPNVVDTTGNEVKDEDESAE